MKRIQDIPQIRTLCLPYVDARRRKTHERYLRSPDSWYLKTLKGIHAGERCFIIGNGPSLRAEDLDKLKGEYTFAANRIFKIFDQTDWRPTYYLCVDDKVMSDIGDSLLDYDLGHMFLEYRKEGSSIPTNKLTRIYNKRLTMDVARNLGLNTALYISEDVSNHFCDCATITMYAIQLAIYMGFKEIYLLGVDHNYSRTLDASGKVHYNAEIKDYFDNKRYYASTHPAAMQTLEYAYTIAKEYGDTHGIKIYNATRGGKLEVFERVNFDELMKNK